MKTLQFSATFSLYLGNGTRQSHSYNGMLIGTYTRPTQGAISNDLERLKRNIQ